MILVTAAVWMTAGITAAETLVVAVAANFHQTGQALADAFESLTGHQVTVVPGSTGKHYAQIVNGAPFDIFLAADSAYPQRLEEESLALPATRFTYAGGTLVLWSPEADLVDPEGRILERAVFRHLSLANPDLAPYGAAARQVLETLGLWESLQSKIVWGESIGQAFQFVASGAADLGFVALSQIKAHARKEWAGSMWRVPQELYRPIEQQAILLSDSRPGRDFLDFLRSEAALELIREFGYQTPASPVP